MTPQTEHRALIPGASSGIGQATGLALAQAGIPVALVGRSKVKLAEVAGAVRQAEVQTGAYTLDLADVDRVKENIQAIDQDFEPIDILINNVGTGYDELVTTPLADWQYIINLNLTSVFQCIQGILPAIRSRQHATIVNIVLIAGRQAFAGWGAYCASKFGLMGLSKTLAVEERTHGIRVMAVCPGTVNTPLWDAETVRADFNAASRNSCSIYSAHYSSAGSGSH